MASPKNPQRSSTEQRGDKPSAANVSTNDPNKPNAKKDELVNQTKAAADQATQTGQEIADEVKRRAQDLLGEQQALAAEQAASISQALRKTAEQFDDDQALLARGFQQTARTVDTVAGALRDNDLKSLAGELESYTRRHPALVLGGASLAGFLLTRFLKSSVECRDATPGSTDTGA